MEEADALRGGLQAFARVIAMAILSDRSRVPLNDDASAAPELARPDAQLLARAPRRFNGGQVRQRLISMGKRVAHGGRIAQCPTHDDNNPSLSIGEGDDGCAILHCHQGCSIEDVLAALDLSPERRREAPDNAPAPIVATYDYRDEEGILLFQVVRRADKRFFQRRPDSNGGWIKNLDETRRVLFQLPQLLKRTPLGLFSLRKARRTCSTS